MNTNIRLCGYCTEKTHRDRADARRFLSLVSVETLSSTTRNPARIDRKLQVASRSAAKEPEPMHLVNKSRDNVEAARRIGDRHRRLHRPDEAAKQHVAPS